MTFPIWPPTSISSSRLPASARRSLALTPRLLPSVPQEFMDVDRDKVLKHGVPIADIYTTLQTYMGGSL